jgi:protein tyrosine/serine phosphatase
MKRTINFLYVLAITLVAACAGLAQTSRTAEAFPNIKIKNFGQMDTNYYRGGQPKVDQYQSLKDLGVTTVIDLRNDSEDYEKPAVEALGMKYINIPMDDKEYPSDATVARILKELNDPANGVMYVHCKGGKHRAGVAGALYRYTKDGWNYDQVMNEMERFKFDTSWGRKVMKDFVIDYGQKMKQQQAAAASAGR